MKIGTARSIRGPGVGGVALAVMAVLTAACASGGGAPPLTGAEATALFADLTGVWVLDDSGSSPQIETATRREVTGFVKTSTRAGSHTSGATEQIASPGVMEATFEVLRRRPEVLTLVVDSVKLLYMPLSGQNIVVPMNGGWTAQIEGEWEVRTRVLWDDGKLGLEHEVGAGAWVTEVLEVVDGRLQVTRAIHHVREAIPLVLIYDRDEGGG